MVMFEVGDEVYARWPDTFYYYPAVVISRQPHDHYRVRFSNGSTLTTEAKDMFVSVSREL